MQLTEKPNKNSKFLVCVGPSPSSAKIIEHTAKMAKAFNAKWVALYIETPDTLNLSSSSNKSLKSNVELARALGAEFVQIEGYNIAIAVAEYSKEANVTNLVIGKSRNKKTLKSYFQKSLEEQIISLLEDVEVHIVPDVSEKSNFNEPKSKSKFHLSDLLKTLAFWAVATGVCFALQSFGFIETNFILLYALTVILTSLFTHGYIFGIISSVLSVLSFDFLFVEPNFAFHLIDSNYLIVLVTMFCVSVVMSMATANVKNKSHRAVRREKRLEDLHVLSQKIIKIQGYKQIISALEEYFANTLKLPVEFFDESLIRNAKEDSVLSKSFEKGEDFGKFSNNEPELDFLYIPVKTTSAVLGVLAIDCKEILEFDEEERTFIKMAISQFALAIEKQLLQDAQKRSLILFEKEKTRSNLLRSVSHDLRTPLTAIYGSASTILNENLSEETVKQLAQNICEDSEWLIRMVENLLAVTKINGDNLTLKKQPEIAEEIILEAVARVKSRHGANNIKVTLPTEILFVPMDGLLIEQVIINLLDNCVKYSPQDKLIELTLHQEEQSAVFTVSDNGNGITQKEISAIEEGLVEGSESSSDRKKGMGIGLSLCHTIIKAHGGKITARNKKSGGAEFIITLPMGENNNE